MAFFQNNITSAIADHNAQNKILVAFVKGTDEVSSEVEKLYNDPEVKSILQDCIGISMNVNSEEGKLFSDMYPVVIVPSSYFISFNGIPIEVIAGTLPKEEFVSKIIETKKLHLETLAKNGVVVAPSSVSATSIPEASLEDPKPQTSTASNDSSKVNVESPAPVKETSPKPEAVVTESPADLEERIKRATELREMNKYIKEQEELKKAKDQEKNRIRESKDLLSAQGKRQQNEADRMAKEVAKEREEAKLYHQRLKDQIAQDKAERAAIEAQRLAIQQGDPALQKQNQAKEEAVAKARAISSNSNIARVQFRLPDGSVVVHQFDASEPLQNLYDFVRNEIRPGFSDFHLAMQYPRQQFSALDFGHSLKDMCLVPSASVLVIPVPTLTSQAVTATSSSLYSMLSFITLPFFQLYDRIKRWFYPGSAPRPSPPPTYTASSYNRANQNTSAPPTESSAPNQSTAGTSGVRKRKLSPRNVQKKGNVFQLANASDEEDDEDNTWNGNSTQQM